jgi:hypothetical protein
MIDGWNGQIGNGEQKIANGAFNFLYSAGDEFIETSTSFGGFNFLLHFQPAEEIEIDGLLRESTKVYPDELDVDEIDATTESPSVEDFEASEISEAPSIETVEEIIEDTRRPIEEDDGTTDAPAVETIDAVMEVSNSGLHVEDAGETTDAPAADTIHASVDVVNSSLFPVEENEEGDDDLAPPESTHVDNDEADTKGATEENEEEFKGDEDGVEEEVENGGADDDDSGEGSD